MARLLTVERTRKGLRIRQKRLHKRRSWFRRAFERLFPQRHLIVRSRHRLRHLTLSTVTQIALVLALMIGTGTVGFLAGRYVDHARIVSAKEQEIAQRQRAYERVLGEIDDYERRIADVSRDLAEKQAAMRSLIDQNAHLRDDLEAVADRLQRTEAEKTRLSRNRERLRDQLVQVERQLTETVARRQDMAASLEALYDRLQTTEAERQEIAQAGQALTDELLKMDTEVRKLARSNQVLEENLNQLEQDYDRVISERNQLLAERHDMTSRITSLEDDLSRTEAIRGSILADYAEAGRHRIAQIENLLSRAGLEPTELVPGETRVAVADDASTWLGQGGPFVELSLDQGPREDREESLSSLREQLTRLRALEGLMVSLPLLEPVVQYRVTSTFGPRSDPFNRRRAMHYGLDMAAPVGTPIHVPAPGTVTYAGWRGHYGRLIEVDHGNGIRTRYGHLSSIAVEVGDVVERRDVIGEMGSSGRSTGSHLHYEVRIKGTPRDPRKFIEAGRYVFQGKQG